jgi:hypothetical protein
MKHFTHDQLHALMEARPDLKSESDRIHTRTRAILLDDMLGDKIDMVQLYLFATDCKNEHSVKESIREAIEYLAHQGQTLEELRTGDYFAEYLKVVKAMSRVRAKRGLCHSPNANDLVCFCQ